MSFLLLIFSFFCFKKKQKSFWEGGGQNCQNWGGEGIRHSSFVLALFIFCEKNYRSFSECFFGQRLLLVFHWPTDGGFFSGPTAGNPFHPLNPSQSLRCVHSSHTLQFQEIPRDWETHEQHTTKSFRLSGKS